MGGFLIYDGANRVVAYILLRKHLDTILLDSEYSVKTITGEHIGTKEGRRICVRYFFDGKIIKMPKDKKFEFRFHPGQL